MNHFTKLILFLVFATFLSSCISYKKVTYFKDLDSSQVNVPVSAYRAPQIQKADMLGIYISSRSESTQILFGAPPSEADNRSRNDGPGGFKVNDDGFITIPTIGKLKAEGLTERQLEDTITKKAAWYVKEPTVSVRITNFKVTVNGEVSKPGVFTIPNGKINVLEALTMAGDLKLSAKRENILVMRQEKEGLTTTRLNLNSKGIFSSPYFHLQNNDMVYVEPNLDRLQREDNVYRNISVGISLLSILSLLIFRLHN